jgi:hypothetical protein
MDVSSDKKDFVLYDKKVPPSRPRDPYPEIDVRPLITY